MSSIKELIDYICKVCMIVHLGMMLIAFVISFMRKDGVIIEFPIAETYVGVTFWDYFWLATCFIAFAYSIKLLWGDSNR